MRDWLSGGWDEENQFVGRRNELQRVLCGKLQNHFVFAAHQTGKSIFLRAVKREMAKRPDVEVTYVSDPGTSLAKTIASESKLPASDLENPLGLRASAQGTPQRPRLWLIDEADKLVKAESQRGFQETRIMRELAEARLAYFILAGSWHFYRTVYLGQHTCLRDFAERIDLGPLDPEAARELATGLLERGKSRFDSPETMELLLQQTGCRANLIAIACSQATRLMGRKDRPLARALLEQVFDESSFLKSALTYFRFNTTLEQAVLRAAALVGERPTRNGIRKKLESAGARLKQLEAVDLCLEHLRLAYLLVPDGRESYRFAVPLLLRIFKGNSDQEQQLRDDIEYAAREQAAIDSIE